MRPGQILLPCPEHIYMSGPCWSAADWRQQQASPMMIDRGAERDAEVCGPAAGRTLTRPGREGKRERRKNFLNAPTLLLKETGR